MDNYLTKIISLAQKTGDKIIVLDPQNPQNVFVLLPIEEYEKTIDKKSQIKDLTEDELIDKINRDIAIWKSEQNFDFFDNEYDSSLMLQKQKNNENYNNLGYNKIIGYNKIRQQEEKGFINNSEPQKETKKRKRWTIPGEMKKKAEEVIEEDKQYLEEIYI